MADESLRSYLVVADTSQTNMSDFIDKIDAIDSIVNWQKILPDALVVVSGEPVNAVSAAIKGALESKRFLIVKLDAGGKNGWLAKSAWEFMNNPKRVGT